MKIKICGNHQLDAIKMVEEAKPDYMGFVVNCPASPRSNSASELVQKTFNLKVPYVFLFVNEKIENILSLVVECKPFAIQLHGEETKETVKELRQKCQHVEIWKAIHLPQETNKIDAQHYLSIMNEYGKAGCDLFVLDSFSKNHHGGSGVTHDWTLSAILVKQTAKPILLAGGLHPRNVQEAIRIVKPFGVDVSSGVEIIKGKKDPDLIREFIHNVRLL